MDLEHCVVCDEPTGKAGKGDDSLYLADGTGPYCQTCFDERQASDTFLEDLADLLGRTGQIQKGVTDGQNHDPS